MEQYQSTFLRSSMAKLSGFSCYNCKKGHRKCDKLKPACGRCGRMKVECSYTRYTPPAPAPPSPFSSFTYLKSAREPSPPSFPFSSSLSPPSSDSASLFSSSSLSSSSSPSSGPNVNFFESFRDFSEVAKALIPFASKSEPIPRASSPQRDEIFPPKEEYTAPSFALKRSTRNPEDEGTRLPKKYMRFGSTDEEMEPDFYNLSIGGESRQGTVCAFSPDLPLNSRGFFRPNSTLNALISSASFSLLPLPSASFSRLPPFSSSFLPFSSSQESPSASLRELSTEPNSSSPEEIIQPFESEDVRDLTERFNKLLGEKEVNAIGSWNMQMFSTLGWLREFNVDEEEMCCLDEESRLQCALYDDPIFQSNLVNEQTYPTILVSNPYMRHNRTLRLLPLRVLKVNSDLYSIWIKRFPSGPFSNCIHPSSHKRLLDDLKSHAIAPSSASTAFVSYPVVFLDASGNWRDCMLHSIHFFDADGFLHHIARVFQPAVAPLRRISTEKEDTEHCPPVPLPPLHSLLSPLSLPFPTLSSFSSLATAHSSRTSLSLPHFSFLLTPQSSLAQNSSVFCDDSA